MDNVAFIGDRMSVLFFGAVGAKTVFAETKEETVSGLAELIRDGYKVIYITEKSALDAKEIIDKYRFEQEPAIILIPGTNGNTGEGIANVEISVEKAIGSKLV